MNEYPKIVESEYEIMKTLWEHGEMTSSEIYEEVSNVKNWSKSTVITLVNRLVEKKAVSARKRGVYFYSPLVSKEDYRDYSAKSFAQKIFDGNIKKLVAYFCENDDLTEQDYHELKEILERKENSK